MPTVVQFRRGTTTQNENFTGAAGEISIDTQAGTLRVHNGIDTGGSNVASVTYVDTAISSYTGSSSITMVGTLTSLAVAGAVSATGNVTGSYIIGNGSQLTGLPAGYANSDVATYLASGTVSTAIKTTSTISAAGTVTGTQFIGVASSAKYADLAENYLADADYSPGTVVDFGGVHEVTLSTISHSTAVVGIVSTAPAYLMNSDLQGEHVVAIALTGRVPCRVQGPVNKGTVLVAGTVPGTAMAIVSDKFEPGCVVGKAMEAIYSDDIQLIEVAVGRL